MTRHTTFCINSLAHWTGLQPYTEEVTAKGNYLLAFLTSGEGNHNFHHAFPKDFRNGPHPADWDPTKWIIYFLHVYTPLVPSIARTPESAIRKAKAHVHRANADRLDAAVPADERVRKLEELPVWSRAEVRKRHGEWVATRDGRRRRVLLLLEGCVVDAGAYLEDHASTGYMMMGQADESSPAVLLSSSRTALPLSLRRFLSPLLYSSTRSHLARPHLSLTRDTHPARQNRRITSHRCHLFQAVIAKDQKRRS